MWPSWVWGKCRQWDMVEGDVMKLRVIVKVGVRSAMVAGCRPNGARVLPG